MMIRNIMKDQFFLKQKSKDATPEDMNIVQDLLDTMNAYETCVGIAANMIGELKNIIVVKDKKDDLVLINPKIIKTSLKTYNCQEGCLCHEGLKETKRYEKIKVEYFDQHFHRKIKTFDQQTGQIIQHEIDHCHGVLI